MKKLIVIVSLSLALIGCDGGSSDNVEVCQPANVWQVSQEYGDKDRTAEILVNSCTSEHAFDTSTNLRFVYINKPEHKREMLINEQGEKSNINIAGQTPQTYQWFASALELTKIELHFNFQGHFMYIETYDIQGQQELTCTDYSCEYYGQSYDLPFDVKDSHTITQAFDVRAKILTELNLPL